MSTVDFSSLALPAALLENLNSLGYHQMTPIQAAALPIVLQGQDLIAQAQTGSGKTAAFALGLLARLKVQRFRVQSLVLCPTRELADQVANEVRRLGRGVHNIKVLTLCGGVPFGPQLGSLEHGAHIIVGTPGRVLEHLEKGSLKLEELNTLVLDEADRMLDMGFAPALDSLMSFVPQQRLTLLFSATYPAQISQMAARYLNNPQRVTIEKTPTTTQIEQRFYSVSSSAERVDAVSRLLLAHPAESSIVFCNTRRETQALTDALVERGFSALALHGDFEQRDREQTLIRFASKAAAILVATDVAARGLDIDALDLVINAELAHDTETHVHRIGRTGRAAASGLALSLVGPGDDYKLALLADLYPAAQQLSSLPPVSQQTPPVARMACLLIDGGKKQKLRAGDIVGALTADGKLTKEQIGKISVLENVAYVAVARAQWKTAQQQISAGIKGKSFRSRLLG